MEDATDSATGELGDWGDRDCMVALATPTAVASPAKPTTMI